MRTASLAATASVGKPSAKALANLSSDAVRPKCWEINAQ
jgi:hypothetical protein